jgi:outer membrane immunogenic protein
MKSSRFSWSNFLWAQADFGNRSRTRNLSRHVRQVAPACQAIDTGGFVGGGQIGCDYQFANGWVVGGVGRVAGMTMKHSANGTVTSFATGDVLASRFNLENDVLASITARVGYRLADRLLGYVRGGAAITHESADNAFTNENRINVDPTGALTRTGWTVGGGLDWAFAPSWSANFEYDYYNFGSQDLTVNSVTNSVDEGSINDTIHTVIAGVNYHF